MAEAVVILVSCADSEEAARIGRALVERRLAACVQMRPHHSIYRWRGAIEQASEIELLIKTLAARAEGAMALVRALHSYDLPAMVCMPVQADEATEGWLGAETQAPGSPH